MAPLIKFIATVIATSEPANITRLFPISSQLIPPILFKASAMITSAAATPTSPILEAIMFGGNIFIAATTRIRAPAIAENPLPISSQLILPKSDIADANIFIDAAIITKEAPVDMTCLALPARLVNMANSSNNPPIAASPLPISAHLIPPKSLHAEANTLIAADMIRIPTAVDMALPSNLARRKNPATSPRSTPTPTNPLASPPQFNSDRSIQAEANTFIAKASITRPPAPFTICVPDMSLEAATKAPVRPTILTSPLATPLQLRSLNFFMAPARMATEIDIAIITPQAFVVFPIPPLILVNIAMEPSNSPNKAVIAPIATANFSESINERVSREAANIPTAPAILRRVPALRFCWYASRHPLTSSRTPLIPSNISLNPTLSFLASLKPLVNLVIAIVKPPNDKLLIKSIIVLKSAFLIASDITFAAPLNTSPTLLANANKTGDIFCIKAPIAENAFLTPSASAVRGSKRAFILSAKDPIPLVSMLDILFIISDTLPTNFPIPLVTDPTTLLILSIILLNTSPFLRNSLSLTMPSPILAVNESIPLPAGRM